LRKSNKILKTLFPAESLDSLQSLSREDLLELLQKERKARGDENWVGSSEEDLNCLDISAQQDFEWDESVGNQDPLSNVSDDVNGLSLVLDHKTSYLGISSISAIIKVIVAIAPNSKAWIIQGTEQAREQYQSMPKIAEEANLPDEQSCIDAYFMHVHNSTPMLDEDQFRAKYAKNPPAEGPWLALLNMVLAMGSIAASKSNDHAHLHFYQRAHRHLPLEAMGAGHLETVQALAILGGNYLHYLNKPNMASVITGAALRMAIALGLHREPLAVSTTLDYQTKLLFELRRRTWWSLFCLDTWASTTLGRPSLGRWDPHCITVELPISWGADVSSKLIHFDLAWKSDLH
jgi:hypothetical protein